MKKNGIAAKVIYNHLPRVQGEVKQKATGAVKRTLVFMERSAKERMEGPKHGRIYPRRAITVGAKGKRGKGLIAAGARARIGMRVVDPKTKGARVTVGYTYHRASAPGEAPAVDLGALRESVQSEMVGDLAGVVFTNQIYGPVLEFGGRRIRPRPFFKPTAIDGQVYFVNLMIEALGDLK